MLFSHQHMHAPSFLSPLFWYACSTYSLVPAVFSFAPPTIVRTAPFYSSCFHHVCCYPSSFLCPLLALVSLFPSFFFPFSCFPSLSLQFVPLVFQWLYNCGIVQHGCKKLYQLVLQFVPDLIYLYLFSLSENYQQVCVCVCVCVSVYVCVCM